MKKRGKNFIFIVIAILLIAGVVAYFYLTPEEKTDEFDVGAILLKTAIKENGLLLKSVKLTNNGADDVFKISTTLQDFVFPIENEIFLESGSSKELEINFKDATKAGPEVFTGELIVSSTKSSKKVPVILEIESEYPFFDININIPIKYEEVYSGGKFVTEVKVFNLENLNLKDVELEYFVKDFGNNVLFSESENIIVENQASLNKAIDLPEDIKLGNYVFIASVKYGGLTGTSAQFFKVTKPETALSSLLTTNLAYLIVIIITTLVIIVVLTLIYITSRKDKLITELMKHHQRELDILQGSFEKSKKGLTEKKKSSFEKIKEARIEALKRRQVEQIEHLKKLKKLGKREEMLEKLKQWKKQGYSVVPIEFKVKKPTVKDIKKRIKDLKKKGYKTKILEERLSKRKI